MWCHQCHMTSSSWQCASCLQLPYTTDVAGAAADWWPWCLAVLTVGLYTVCTTETITLNWAAAAAAAVHSVLLARYDRSQVSSGSLTATRSTILSFQRSRPSWLQLLDFVISATRSDHLITLYNILIGWQTNVTTLFGFYWLNHYHIIRRLTL